MPEKILIITPKDIDEDGVVKYDFSGWDGNIVLPPVKMCIIGQPLKCGTIHSESEITIFNHSVSCYFFKIKNAHVKGNLITLYDILSHDLIVDGDVSVNNNCTVNNITVIGHISIKGNINCSKKAMFMGRSYISGKNNIVYGKKLNEQIPFVFFDQCAAKLSDQQIDEVIIPDRICIAFCEDGEEMIFVGNEKIPMKLNRFNCEFSDGCPGLVKYIEEIKKYLKQDKLS